MLQSPFIYKGKKQTARKAKRAFAKAKKAKDTMKRAFTILELIFVIVILGILAAIALPRLGAGKDEAQIAKALSNLKTIITDLHTYAMKNDALSSTAAMSNVAGLENVDLSNFTGVKSAKFGVGSDETCLEFVFINASHILAFGIAPNDNVKSLIENLAYAQNESLKNGADLNAKTAVQDATNALLNAEFTSTSANKACASLSSSQSFKSLANKSYILLGN